MATVGEKAKQTMGKIQTALKSVSKKVRILLVIVLLATAAVIVGIAIHNANRPYTVLFTGLSTEDMSSVQSFLETNGVTNYRVENSNTITVPESQEPAIRALLVQEKYPTSGFGYERYLNNIGTLSSNSDREILMLYDLQDRLGATIRCIKGVKEATVFINESEDHSYILDTDNVIEATATVMVEMQDGGDLPAELAESIRSMVSTAVQDLSFDNITVGDTNGNTYGGGDESINAKDESQLRLALEAQVNDELRRNIMQVLIPLFGAENLRVTVSSTVDVSRTYHDETTYEEPEWAADGSTNGEGIIGKRIWDNGVILGENETAGGTVGTSTNADLNEYVEEYTPDGSERELASSGEIDYNVDTFREQRESAGGIVTDVMVAVSVNEEVGGRVDAGALRAHVARAARISPELEAEKISILIGPFYEEEEDGENGEETPEAINGLPNWIFFSLLIGIVLFIILLVAIILLRHNAKLRAKREAEEQAELERQRAAAAAALMAESTPPPAQGADIMDLHSERSMELRMNVRQFAEENPEICAQMVKIWLKGGEEENGGS